MMYYYKGGLYVFDTRSKKVEEVMDTKFTTIDEDTRIEDAIKEMIKSNTKTLMVIDSSGQLKGIISMTDIHNLYEMHKKYEGQPVKLIMKKDVIYVNEGLTLDECRDIMILKI